MKDGNLEGQETGRAPGALGAEVVDLLFVPVSRAFERFSCATQAAESQALPSGVRLGT